jgi:hypothetical protein
MIIDAKKSTIRNQLRKLFFLLLLVLFLVVLYTTGDSLDPYMLGIDRSKYALAATVAYALFYSLSYFRDTSYIYFNNNSSKIIIRYYSLRPLTNDQNSLEIHKAEFYKAEISEKLGGLRRYLIIYQRTAKGVAKYAPISISILKKKDVEQLARELNITR